MVKTVWALILALILMVSGLAACGRDVVTEEKELQEGWKLPVVNCVWVWL